ELGDDFEEKLYEFISKNSARVVRLARPDYKAVSAEARRLIDESKSRRGEVLLLERESHSDMFFLNGERVLFYSDKLKLIDGNNVAGEPLTSLWDDILSNNLHNEGGVEFPKGKKPEALIKRCLEMATVPGDLVLDSFAGSGTTGAVAHKMGRRWIMVELGEHCHTHIVPRLRKVIDGDDPGGVTSATGWKGGGGFRYYRLAPSLLSEDAFGNRIINPEYRPEMLAEAVCKLMGIHLCAQRAELLAAWPGVGTGLPLRYHCRSRPCAVAHAQRRSGARAHPAGLLQGFPRQRRCVRQPDHPEDPEDCAGPLRMGPRRLFLAHRRAAIPTGARGTAAAACA
ncbi:site-specific DNA-methyltransferase, partial [Xanthomonas hortorum]